MVTPTPAAHQQVGHHLVQCTSSQLWQRARNMSDGLTFVAGVRSEAITGLQ